ncbi:MAG TPA: hypothetical protein VHK44_00425 [Xanthobacteraceae bacterium]|nr:hypothetical protein [Xanthobacteraceae bacterium]
MASSEQLACAGDRKADGGKPDHKRTQAKSRTPNRVANIPGEEPERTRKGALAGAESDPASDCAERRQDGDPYQILCCTQPEWRANREFSLLVCASESLKNDGSAAKEKRQSSGEYDP